MTQNELRRLLAKYKPKTQYTQKTDAIKNNKPVVVNPVKYKPKADETVINLPGQKPRIVRRRNEVVSTDNRSNAQRRLDWKKDKQTRQYHQQQKNGQAFEEGVNAMIKLTSPSTYVGAAARALTGDGTFGSNLTSGTGFNDPAANIAFDLASPYTINKGLTSLNKIANLGKSVYYSNTPSGQYLRFVGGKLKYGFDAKLPDLIRRTEKPMLSINVMRRNSPIRVSPTENRFRFEDTGELSPVITNFTTDLPVIPNNGGSWEGFNIGIIKGNQLLGKNVISTRPMDTFTYGDKIIVPKRNITIIPNVNKNGIVPEQELIKKCFENYKRPTLKDYKFMDYVFRPKYTSEVIPNTKLTFENASTHPLGKYLFDGDMRQRINQPFKNVMYDIAPTVESEFRNDLGIALRSHLK